MSEQTNPEHLEGLKSAYYVWFSTVRDDGMPQPTPVWFIEDGDTFLIYSMPTAQKVANIQDNPKVALSYAPDSEASTYMVVMGEAMIDPNAPRANEHAAYRAKYAEGIKGIGMTEESMAAAFNVAIRVTPTRVRGN